MKRLILFLILAVFGLFVYFISFKGEVYLLFIPVLAVLIAVYYVISSLVTEKMIEKKRDDENFFYLKCSKISDDETSTVPGALAVTSSEIVFYVRKDAVGNIKPAWSCSVSEIESYDIRKVDERHSGIAIKLAGAEDEVKFISSSIAKKEAEFKKQLGWT